MKRRISRIFVSCILTVALAACGGSKAVAPPPPPPSVAGQWVGMTGTQQLAMTLAESGQTVNGSATLTNTPSGTMAMTISGVFASPTLTVTLQPGGNVQAVSLTATYGGNRLVGSLTGSGFTGDAITLTRQ